MSYIDTFKEIACAEISGLTTPPRVPEFIDYSEAYFRVKKLQTEKEVGAFMVSIAKLKEFLNEIDSYNSGISATSNERITDIRIWKAVSYYNAEYPIVNDLLMVPVRKDTNDLYAFTENLPRYSLDPSKTLMLGSFRPCPNLCGDSQIRKYFHNEDPSGDGPPPAALNRYNNLPIPNCQEIHEMEPDDPRYIE